MRLRTCTLLCCLLALSAADRALAQGTSGMLPAPISSRDLDLYSDTLALTPEQRDQIDAMHGAYLEAFRVLRENDIAEYMGEVGGMWRAGLRSMNRDAIQESIHTLDRLMTKIRLTDDQLFDGIHGMLTEEQSTRLARVMQARDRQRYSAGGTRMIGFVNRAARVDLSRLFAGLELTPQQREAIDPYVVQYEGRLTAETKDLYEATTHMFLAVVDSLEEQGVSFDDPAAIMQNPGAMREAMQTAFSEAVKEPRERAAAIGDLNRRSLRQVSELMDGGAATTLRDRYLRRAYPEVPRTTASSAQHGYQAALNSRNLPESVRADISAAASEYRATRQVVVEEMIDTIDEFRRTWSPMTGGRGGRGRGGNGPGGDTDRQKYEADLETFRDRLNTIDETALDALCALVDQDVAETIRTAAASGADDAAGEAGSGPGGAAASARDAAGGLAPPGPDPVLPPPITRRDLATYRDRLALSDTDWYVLQSLHEEYVGNFNKLRETSIAAVRAAEKTEMPTPEQIDALYELRAEALRAIQQVDGLFFDDVETLIASPEQQADAQRLRLARDRFIYNRGTGETTKNTIFEGAGGRQRAQRGRGRGGRPSRGPWGGLAGTSTMEAAVDLGLLVDRIELTDAQRTETSKLLIEYETAARDGFRQQYETSMRLRRESEKLRAQMQRQPDAGGGNDEQERARRRDRWQAYQQLMEGDGAKADQARQVMVELNRATLGTLTDALADDESRALEDLYNTTAFPDIYDNRQAAGRYLVEAMQMPDLADQQRARIEAIYAEYQPEYRQVADRMRDVYAEDVTGTGNGPDRWRGFQERRNKLEVLDFDRREVNDKAFRQLREVLTDEQETRLRLPAARTDSEGDAAL